MNPMRILLAIILSLNIATCTADSGFYIAGGLGTFYPADDCEEACFKDKLLAYGQIGYSFQVNGYKKFYIDASATHASAPTTNEDRGCELYSIMAKKYF